MDFKFSLTSGAEKVFSMVKVFEQNSEDYVAEYFENSCLFMVLWWTFLKQSSLRRRKKFPCESFWAEQFENSLGIVSLFRLLFHSHNLSLHFFLWRNIQFPKQTNNGFEEIHQIEFDISGWEYLPFELNKILWATKLLQTGKEFPELLVALWKIFPKLIFFCALIFKPPLLSLEKYPVS